MWNPGIGFISTTEAPFLVRRVVWWRCVWSYRRAPHRLQRPQPVYSYGALAFVVATVVWVVACLRTKAQGHCIILQLKMLVLPPLKAVALLVAYLQWAEKADGEPVGQWSTGMAPFAALTNVAYRAAFFECLMVLAKGMCNMSGVAGAQGVTASYVPCVPCRRLAYHASVHHKGRAPGAWVCVPATYGEWLRLTRVCVWLCGKCVRGIRIRPIPDDVVQRVCVCSCEASVPALGWRLGISSVTVSPGAHRGLRSGTCTSLLPHRSLSMHKSYVHAALPLQLVYAVWHGARLNILETLANIRMVRDHGVDPRLADVHVKYHMFRCLRNAFLMYLLSEAVTDVMARSPLFDEQYPWVPVLADEVCCDLPCCVDSHHTCTDG